MNIFEVLDHDNNIHEYGISRLSRHVRYCALKKKLSKVAQYNLRVL